MTPADQTNFIAAHAVAAAEDYLRGREDPAGLLFRADQMIAALALALRPCPRSADIPLYEPTRMLLIATRHTAIATDELELRWRNVMDALKELVRAEARALANGGRNGQPT